jgi:hypothetical protein
MPRLRTPEEYLLVEGKDDKHVVTHLCIRHGLPTIAIREPNEDGEGGGIDELLAGITRRLREPRVRTFGMVVDADQDLPARWQALRNRLLPFGYASFPATPPQEGWVSAESLPMRVGVWLMPDNQLPGILEDFVAQLIPPDDALRGKAEAILAEIEREGLRRYSATQRPKALIHTWLAWQETPGQPMGTAITARSLSHDSPLATTFVAWLRRLFALPAAPEVA